MTSPARLFDKDAAWKLYAELLALNPHLPPAGLVTADDIELSFGLNRIGTLRLTVFVELPVPAKPAEVET